MNFGDLGTDKDEAARIVHASLDRGLNFFDTANVYSRGRSEEMLGAALSEGRRDKAIVATKVHGVMGEGPNDQGNSRTHIMRMVEDSLRRLQTDWIDLYQLHRPDPDTPIEETLEALDDLVTAGKVRYIGISTFAAWQTVEALWVSDRRGLARIVSEQPPYNVLHREIEKEVLPVCQRYSLAVLPWSPLSGGILSGKYRKGQDLPAGSRFERMGRKLQSSRAQRQLAIVEELLPLAADLGITLTQLALAWLLAQSAVTAPIIGPRTLEQLEDNAAAVDVTLSAAILSRIDELVPPGTSTWT
jgi:aryl-alcohol dehydrogenase-like predicted oxidoreductase